MRKIGILLTIVGSLMIVNKASAYNFGETGRGIFDASSTINTPSTTASRITVYWNPTNGESTYYFTGTSWSGARQLVLTSGNPSAGSLKEIVLKPYNTRIPAGSLFHFSIRYSSASTSSVNSTYNGIQAGTGWTLLDSTCSPYSQTQSQSSSSTTYAQYTGILCDYYGYTQNALSQVVLSGNIFTFPIEGLVLIAQGYDYVTINNESGGSVDITDLSQNVQYILGEIRNNNAQNTVINANIEDIKDLLEELSSTGSLSPTAIENAIESARENEKEEYEQQQEDVNDGAESAGTEAESQTSNLINTAKGIIEVIRDTPATNCNIRIIRGTFDTGELNLCNVPQQIRTVISTIIVIPVTLAALHIAYSLVTLYLRTVRKEQE